MRHTYDKIYDSIINGQRRQAVQQAIEMGIDDIPEMLDYFAKDLDQPEIAIDFAKSYFRIEAR